MKTIEWNRSARMAETATLVQSTTPSTLSNGQGCWEDLYLLPSGSYLSRRHFSHRPPSARIYRPDEAAERYALA